MIRKLIIILRAYLKMFVLSTPYVFLVVAGLLVVEVSADGILCTFMLVFKTLPMTVVSIFGIPLMCSSITFRIYYFLPSRL